MGTVFVGAARRLRSRRVCLTDADPQCIVNQIRTTLGLRSSLQWVIQGGQQVLEIRVSQVAGLVSYRGMYLTRVGTTNRDLSPEQMARVMLSKSGHTWDSLPSFDGTKVVAPAAVNRLLRLSPNTSARGRRARNNSGKPEPSERGPSEPRRLLLFGQNPQRFFPTAQVYLGHFKVDQIVGDQTVGGISNKEY